jgi:hypothetical protein
MNFMSPCIRKVCVVVSALVPWFAGISGMNAEGVPVPALREIPRVKVTLADLRAQYPVGKGGGFVLGVPQVLHMALDPEVAALIRGQRVELLGEWVGDGAGRWRVVRSQLGCCSAHAKESGVLVEAQGNLPYRQKWVRVMGELGFERNESGWTPVVRGATVEETEAPAAAVLK